MSNESILMIIHFTNNDRNFQRSVRFRPAIQSSSINNDFSIRSLIVSSRNEAYQKLSPKAPPQRVIHLPMLASLLSQIFLMTVVQTIMYEWTINQEWFCSISDNFPDCFERNEEGGILRALNVTDRCPRDGTCISEVPHLDFTCDDKG